MNNSPKPGCYLDHSYRSIEELSRDVIDLAESFGFTYKEGTKEEREDPEYLDWIETKAIAWLNDHAAPADHVWGHCGDRGAFGLWSIEEDAQGE